MAEREHILGQLAIQAVSYGQIPLSSISHILHHLFNGLLVCLIFSTLAYTIQQNGYHRQAQQSLTETFQDKFLQLSIGVRDELLQLRVAMDFRPIAETDTTYIERDDKGKIVQCKREFSSLANHRETRIYGTHVIQNATAFNIPNTRSRARAQAQAQAAANELPA